MKIAIDKKEVAELLAFNLPVYIFGIDEAMEQGFFIAANVLNTELNINGTTTRYPITQVNLERLYKEVADYWNNSHKNTKFVSSFK